MHLVLEQTVGKCTQTLLHRLAATPAKLGWSTEVDRQPGRHCGWCTAAVDSEWVEHPARSSQRYCLAVMAVAEQSHKRRVH